MPVAHQVSHLAAVCQVEEMPSHHRALRTAVLANRTAGLSEFKSKVLDTDEFKGFKRRMPLAT